jgi:hypothetical protein
MEARQMLLVLRLQKRQRSPQIPRLKSLLPLQQLPLLQKSQQLLQNLKRPNLDTLPHSYFQGVEVLSMSLPVKDLDVVKVVDLGGYDIMHFKTINQYGKQTQPKESNRGNKFSLSNKKA